MSQRQRLDRAISALVLFRLQPRWLDGLATAAVVAVLAWSRFGLLASGPWEWDEAAFARALLDFDLQAYFPHPPGYPGWIALGRLLAPFAPEPLVALQWASAGLSVAALWPLAALGRRVAPPAVAVAAAVVVLAAPGPWLHAVRGFSSTAAGVLALAAAAVAAGGSEGMRPTAFTVLVAAAFLVRPNLLPPLAVLWLGVALGVRPWRRLWPGIAAALAMGGAALTAMALDQGGLDDLVAVFAFHAHRHFSRLVGNVGGFDQLGLVKGLGGAVPAGLLLAAAVVGLGVWARRAGRGSAIVWAAVLSAALAQLVWMQNRTYPRYAVGVQMALAPLVAGAAGLAPPAVGCGALLAAAGWLGVTSLAVVDEQHRSELPAWQALQASVGEAESRGMAVVVESELHLFASYLWLREEARGLAMPPRVLTPWNPEPWRGVDRPYLVATVHRDLYPPSLVGQERRWDGVSDRLLPLTQGRFLEAWLIVAPPLPIAGWWPGERTPAGEPFLWGGARCELEVPPLPEGAELGLELKPAAGPAPLEVSVNGEPFVRLAGDAQRTWLWIPGRLLSQDRPSVLAFERAEGYPGGGDDQRLLGVQLFGVRAVGAGLAWSTSLVRPDERAAVRLELAGHHLPESFGEVGEGVWLEPHARIDAPAGPGRLVLTAWAPRPVPPQTVIRLASGTTLGPLAVPDQPVEIVVPLASDDVAGGRVVLELESVGYSPARAGAGDDRRELGVVVSRLRYEPAVRVPWTGPLVGSEDAAAKR